MKLLYSQLKISEDKGTGRWFIYYYLLNPKDGQNKRKEFGKKYGISLNRENDILKRDKLARELLEMVKDDLHNGIDPKYRKEEIKSELLKQREIAKKEEEKKVDIDTAIEWLRHDKAWLNPAEGKEKTAAVITMFLRKSFKDYLTRINKAKDIREVTRLDLQNYIEENFNRSEDVEFSGSGKFKNAGWSSSSCSMYKARISLLFGALIDRNLIETNPTVGVKIKKDNEKINQTFTDEDNEDVFAPWSDDESKKWFKDLAKSEDLREQNIFVASNIIYYSFIRKAELLRLKCSMINFEEERFEIPARLTKSARKYGAKDIIYIDIPDTLLNVLRKWIDTRFNSICGKDDYLLFQHGNTKQQYVYGSFSRHFAKVREQFQTRYEGQFKDTVLYALKHTGVIKLYHHLLKSNARPDEIQKTIQKHCRHSDWSETENYLRKSCKIELQSKCKKINF